jgi:CubicO group peptidase (beta-lactamase class C family)
MDSSIGRAARAIIEREIASGYAAGAVALVADRSGHEIIPAGAAILGGAAMQPDTIFRIASMTKPVTAVAALMLVEDGKLALEEPVERLAPELAERKVLRRIDGPLDEVTSARRPITVEDLLTFRLGFGVALAPPNAWPIQRAIAERGLMGFGPPDAQSPLTPDRWISRLGELPLMAQPGERWLYTTGSIVLGVLIARAARQSLPEFMRERIFEPLGMRDTGFYAPPDKARRLCAAYRRMPEGLELADDGPSGDYSRPPPLPAGDAGLVSTAADFFAFDRFLLARGRAGGRPLLSERLVEAMVRDHLTPAQREGDPILGPGRGWGYGLSVVVGETPEAAPRGAYGWFGGYGTSWTCDPATGRTAMVLTQTLFESAEPSAIHQGVAQVVFEPA